MPLVRGVFVVLVMFGACTSEPARTTTGPDRPPVEAAALESDYGDAVRDLGLVLTDRGGLIDRSGGGYVQSPEGTHLALYLEPAGNDHSMERYVEGILTATRVFVPEVFERWPALTSFDVCQEPAAQAGDQPPPPTTQIELTREQAAAIDWETVTVADLVAGAEADPPRLTLRLSNALTSSDAFAEVSGSHEPLDRAVRAPDG